MKQIKKLLIMLLAIAVAVSMVSAAAFATDGSFVVEAGTVSGTAGEDVVMTVKVSSNPGVVAAILNVKYDSAKLALKSATDVNFLNDATETNMGNGECTIVLDNALATADVTNTGDLLKLTFTVAAEVSGEIDVDLTVVEAVNTNLENVAVSAVDGKVIVAEVVTGPSIDDVDTSKLPDTLPAENISFAGNVMTVAPAENTPACVVLIKDAQGNYTKVSASKNGDNYDFDMSTMPEGASIVVAVKGDASGDGVMNSTDLTTLRKALVAESHQFYSELSKLGVKTGDINGDGNVDSTDLTALRKALLASSHNFYASISW